MDSNGLLFEEKQYFRQWWLWIFLLGLNLTGWYGIYQQIFRGIPFGDKPASDTGLWLINALFLFFLLFFASIRLHTKIDHQGISVRFFPFMLRDRRYLFEDLVSCRIRSYRPLREYGGWGIRYGLGKYGDAFNVSGKQGLQLEFKSGRKLLIGTQQAQQLQQVLDSLQLPMIQSDKNNQTT